MMKVARSITYLLTSVMVLTGIAVKTAQATPLTAVACGPHASMVAQLKDRFHEDIVSLGLAGNGHVMQMFKTADGGTWTLLSTTPAGVACILASGQHWQTVIPGPDGPAA